MSDDLQHAKAVVRAHLDAIDSAPAGGLAAAIGVGVSGDYLWRGVHPFYELHGAEELAASFWEPLRASFAPIQRRPDVFLAGENTVGEGIWVCEMGHLLGLFDEPWLGIPPTGRMCFLRYAQFHRVAGDLITESAFFTDVISVMRQAGHYPLPPQTGSSHIHPGPMTHDGLLYDEQDPTAGKETMALVERMVADLNEANRVGNETGVDRMDRSVLAQSWHEDMIWSGPEGIGATYTIDRYQQQHQYPFRFNLSGKRFNGHVARFSEGDYACFFGWSNLTNTADGGFLGMTGSARPADMRVVDVYRRDGDKLAENWVFIDLLHWLSMQGLDVLARMRQLGGEPL
ncbi:MAG: nuclear transport factor 2 family protein [Actinomycetota bacterium]